MITKYDGSYPLIKEMCILQTSSLRELVEMVNRESIQKSDIFTLLQDNGTYSLLYYKA